MTAKDYLNQAYRLDQRINSKLEQILSLRHLAEKATTSMSKTPGCHGSMSASKMESIVDKMVDMENELNAEIDRLVDLKREISQVIAAVDNKDCRTLLELRYLCCKPWEVIAVEMCYGLRHVYKIHDHSIEIVEKILKHGTKRQSMALNGM